MGGPGPGPAASASPAGMMMPANMPPNNLQQQHQQQQQQFQQMQHFQHMQQLHQQQQFQLQNGSQPGNPGPSNNLQGFAFPPGLDREKLNAMSHVSFFCIHGR